MSVRILEDLNEDKAVLYDSVTERPFGLVFYGPLARNRAERFLDSLDGDARAIPPWELEALHCEFMVREVENEPHPQSRRALRLVERINDYGRGAS